MKLLAIETATEACSAALLIDGDVRQKYELAPRRHAELILSMLDQLLAEAELSLTQLDAFAYGRGPGSFIGVRIAASVTQGVAYGADLPVIAISTLAALAQGSNADHILAAIDARMGEIYWGEYSRTANLNSVNLIGNEQLIIPQHAAVHGSVQTTYRGVGSAWHTYGEKLSELLPNVSHYDGLVYPEAQSVAALAVDAYNNGELITAPDALPLYLRDRVAQKPKPKLKPKSSAT